MVLRCSKASFEGLYRVILGVRSQQNAVRDILKGPTQQEQNKACTKSFMSMMLTIAQSSR